MKRSIAVLGIEASGVRGVRLMRSGRQGDWRVADRHFWPVGGAGAAAPDAAAPGDAQDAAAPEDGAEAPDRYSELVEALSGAARRFGTREVVLAAPLSSLIVKVAGVREEDRDRIGERAAEEIGGVSPFPDEQPVAGSETVGEADGASTALFAALPESEAAELGDALDEAKVRVLRTDATALGWLRTRWSDVFPEGEAPGAGKVVLMDCDGGWDVVVLKGQVPSVLRGLGSASCDGDVAREVMLSLIRAGAGAGEIVALTRRGLGEGLAAALGAIAPVRVVAVGGGAEDGAAGEDCEAAFGGVEGVALRTAEGYSLDVTPADWAEARAEARFRRRLAAYVAVAAAGWLLAMGALFGVPLAYGQMEARQKAESRRHAAAFREVKEMRDKVKLVQQYSDRARGALELLKAVSDRMPEGVTLTSFGLRRGERLSLVGEATSPTAVYDFKNLLADAAVEGAEGEEEPEEDARLFAEVNLTGPSQTRSGGHRFSIECLFEAKEEK